MSFLLFVSAVSESKKAYLFLQQVPFLIYSGFLLKDCVFMCMKMEGRKSTAPNEIGSHAETARGKLTKKEKRKE